MKLIIAVVVTLVLTVPVFAQPFTSPNYRIDESFIGPGGFIDAASGNFSARASLGDTGIGNSASNNFQIYGGFTTTDEEYLEFVVNGGISDAGVLSDLTTGTTTATFYVRSYLSQGYVITTVSDPPTTVAGETIEPLTSPTASSTGVEQFGINLVANTNPTTFGADPVQVPDNTFSFGYAANGYETTNLYQYNVGDIVARADSSSGRTDYTISYIFNIAELTEAGEYVMDHTLVATATF